MAPPSPSSGTAEGQPSVPYVGLRPYGREEADWFHGRDADTQVLVDKVLSSRLTLLYAPSGVGKSSLLNARVMPALEDEDCRVVYADGWSGSDPTGDVKDRLAAVASASGVVDPLAGAPTLAELARLLTADGRTLVLVFDQFEEFLLNHAQDLDPLRKELAALVRMQVIDARVLISLREEFLAALEPFRAEILTLFQSTIRLEGLSDADVLSAIREPAARFGGEVDEALARRLLQDLSGSANEAKSLAADLGAARSWLDRLRRRWFGERGSGTGRAQGTDMPGAARSIDLPMMQLVCRSMWDQAPVTDGRRRLSMSLYQDQLGGKDRILAQHIRSCMPRRWSQRLFTAQLMRFLAPRSGMKISYSAEDLADLAEVNGGARAQVRAELVRLSDSRVRILHQRVFRGEVRYELQHDALVRHIAPWRDEVLRDHKLMRGGLWVGAGLLLLAAVYGLDAFRQWQTDERNTTLRLASLERQPEPQRVKQAAQEFGYVVDYLLNHGRGPARLDSLRGLLQGHAALLPDGYALPERIDSSALLMSSADGGLTLRYGAARPFDQAAFQQAWTEVARRLTHRWGIPVPARIALVADEGLTSGTMRLEVQRKPLLSLNDVDPLSGRALVDVDGMVGPAQEFARRFESDWLTPPRLEGSRWKAVPTWSLPVWRYAGLGARSSSAYPALLLESLLDADPGVLATREAAYALASRVADSGYPCTAAEAWAQRKLEKDLAAWVGGGRTGRALQPVVNPHLLFELLIALPDGDAKSDPLQDLLAAAPGSHAAAIERTRRTAWPVGTSPPKDCQVPPPPKQSTANLMSTYMEARSWLSAPPPKLRIALGSDLVRAWGEAVGGQAAREEKLQPPSDKAQTVQRGFAAAAPKGGDGSTQAGQAVAPAAPSALSVERLPILQAAFEAHRRGVYQRNGVWLPDFRAHNASAWMTGPEASSLRVSTFDAKDVDGRSHVVDFSANVLRGVSDGLGAGIGPVTQVWVDAEYIGRLLQEDSPIHDPRLAALHAQWTRIPVGDLSMLLREVLAGEGAGASIRDPGWLLSSLVFWKAFYTNNAGNGLPEHQDLVKSLAGQLRRLQARRFEGGPPRAVPAGAAPALDSGLAALAAGRIKEAEKHFERAVAAGPYRQVADAFIERYAAGWAADVRQRAQAKCEKTRAGTPSELEPKLQMELVSALVRSAGTSALQPTGLWVCLVESAKRLDPKARSELLLQAVGGIGEPSAWPIGHAQRMAQALLESVDPLTGDGSLVEQGRRFLLTVLRKAPSASAEEAFARLSGLCMTAGPKAWCWDLLRQAARERADPWIALDYGVRLLDRESDLEESLAAFQRAEGLSAAKGAIPARDRPRFDAYLKLGRAVAESLRQPGTRAVHQSRLEGSEAVKASPDLHSWLLTSLTDEIRNAEPFDTTEAGRLIELRQKAKLGREAEVGLLSDRIAVAFRGGDARRLNDVLDEAERRIEETDPSDLSNTRLDVLLAAAYAGLVSGHPGARNAATQFLESRHQYVPLVAMLLRWRAGPGEQQTAQQRLLERWSRIDSKTWAPRLAAGDPAVWYEMLLGYSLDKLPASDLFGPLTDDAAFKRSPLAGLGFVRVSMLTEANFYDALKRSQQGDALGAGASLRRVVSTGGARYIEFAMAKALLRANPNWPASAAAPAPR